tara:strand:+ start:1231 stop:1554 length:324 start_codon:yes stop_codon:yes gene_type:complete
MNKIEIGNNIFTLEYDVKHAIQVHNIIYILFNPDCNTKKFGQFKNLIAISQDAKRIWQADLPTNMSGDCYYDIEFDLDQSLLAYSIKSYTCYIDKKNGRILNKVFTK